MATPTSQIDAAPKVKEPIEVSADSTLDDDFGRIRRRSIDLGSIEEVQILDESGTIVDADHLPDLSADELRKIHRAMVLARQFDRRMFNMQRQGEMGTFAPSLGQEAAQIGQVYPMKTEDWFSPSYRSIGAQVFRGWTLEGLLLLWDGYFEGFEIPEGVNDLPFSIVIGSHVPVATGVAIGLKTQKKQGVVVTNFGDGAASQGIVAESFNFAAVTKAPIVFIVENNGWAISTRVAQQSGSPVFASRAVGYGIPSMRVDGNDVLAMISATQRALDHARSGAGPTLIEAVTYRMSLHTTADDPRVYRSDDEVKQWESRCPIRRFETYLDKRGILDQPGARQVEKECKQQVVDARDRFRDRAVAKPREIFDFMYAQMPPELKKQQAEYFERLERKEIE